MEEILVGRASEGVFTPWALEQLFRFRYRVFKERLGWQVSVYKGMEKDFYDEQLDPVHIAVCCNGTVIGSWRLLPTTGPYMLRSTFPELLRGEPVPSASDVWELSRFAVEPADPNARVQTNCSRTTFAMMRACHDFAVSNGIREFVTVTSVAVERMMRSVGVPLERFGDRKATRVGTVLSVACRIPVDHRLHAALYRPTETSGMERSVA